MAYNKPTRQTGVWFDYVSDRAVDGNTDPDQVDGRSCAHPDDSSISQAWWRVDLEGLHRIYSVTLFNTNKYDGEFSFLQNFHGVSSMVSHVKETDKNMLFFFQLQNFKNAKRI